MSTTTNEISKFLCKANADDNVKKAYKLYRYAKAYALKNDLSIYDADGNLVASIEDLKAEAIKVADAVEDAVDTVKETVEETSKKIDDIKEDVQNKVEETVDKVEDIKEDIEDAAEEIAEEVVKSTNGFIAALKKFFAKIASIFKKSDK